MNYTKETKINEIPNAKNILNDTIQLVQQIYDTYTIGDFINVEKESGEESFASTTFGIFGGCGTGAGANVPKKFKGTLTEKVGQALATWRKNANSKLSAAEIAENAKLHALYETAKRMLNANMAPETIAQITGLSVEQINGIENVG